MQSQCCDVMPWQPLCSEPCDELQACRLGTVNPLDKDMRLQDSLDVLLLNHCILTAVGPLSKDNLV